MNQTQFTNPIVFLALLACLAASFQAHADARGFTMAGAGVATGHPTQAAALNPALLAHKTETEQFSLTFPSFALEASDPDDVMDRVRDFQSVLDQINDLLDEGEYDTGELEELRGQLVERYSHIDGQASIDGQVYGQLAFPGKRVAMGVFFSAIPSLYTRASQHPDDVTVIEQFSDSDDIKALRSEGMVIGNMVMETGLLFATELEFAHGVAGIGLTPKLQRIDAFAYNDTIAGFSDRNYDESGGYNNETAFNMDAGVTWLQGNWRSGLSIRNLFKRSVAAPVQQTNILSESGELNLHYEFRPEFTLGLGYNWKAWTIAADLDLNKRRYLALDRESQRDVFSDGQHVQFVRLGLAYSDDSRWQWRTGLRADIQNTYETAVTAGMAYTAFSRMTVDFGLLYSGRRSLGGSMQLAFNF